MAWMYQNQALQVGRSWTDSKGVQYPRNWASWSKERKEVLGLVYTPDPVVESYDERFFSGPGVQRPLTDQPVKDPDGNNVIGLDGKQMITVGLKTIAFKQVKNTASEKLSETDWYVIRQQETGTPMPEDVKQSRAAIRAAANEIETKITNVKNHQALVNLYTAPTDAKGVVTGPAPIHAWPE